MGTTQDDTVPSSWDAGHLTDWPAVFGSIVHDCAGVMPGAQAGICVPDGTGLLATLAATDSLVLLLDDLQFGLDEGPSLAVVAGGHTVVVEDAESEHRWPRFMSHAVDLGLSSFVAVPVTADGRLLGSLNLYSTAHRHVDDNSLIAAKLYAAQAGISVQQAMYEDHLVKAMAASGVIGRAVGLVMERLGLNEQGAFQRLVALSKESNTTLRVIAAAVVTQAG